MNITYRIGTEKDYDALVQFWSDNSGWGAISDQAWKAWFVQTPEGPSTIVLGVDNKSDEILSQFFFIPSAIAICEKTVRGYRPFAPIVKESIRNQGTAVLQDMLQNMYLLAIATLGNAGGSLIHMLPDPRWTRVLQKWPIFQVSGYPHYSFKLPSSQIIDLPASYTLEPIDIADPRVDNLWEKGRRNYGCMIVRNSKTLAYKISQYDVTVMGVSQHSKLIGLFACMFKKEDKQCLILDILSEDREESLEITLKATVVFANNKYLSLPEDKRIFNKVALLATPLMQPIVEKIGFSQERYTYPVLIHLFDPTLTQEEVSPENWYFSAKD